MCTVLEPRILIHCVTHLDRLPVFLGDLEVLGDLGDLECLGDLLLFGDAVMLSICFEVFGIFMRLRSGMGSAPYSVLGTMNVRDLVIFVMLRCKKIKKM